MRLIDSDNSVRAAQCELLKEQQSVIERSRFRSTLGKKHFGTEVVMIKDEFDAKRAKEKTKSEIGIRRITSMNRLKWAFDVGSYCQAQGREPAKCKFNEKADG